MTASTQARPNWSSRPRIACLLIWVQVTQAEEVDEEILLPFLVPNIDVCCLTPFEREAVIADLFWRGMN